MASVRRWSVRRLVSAWIVIPALFFVARWILLMIGEGLVALPDPIGPASIVLTLVAALALLGWMTSVWLSGRDERHWADVMNRQASQRILR